MLRSILYRLLCSLCLALLLAGLVLAGIPSGPPPPLVFINAQYDNPGLHQAISAAVSPDGSHVYIASNLDDAVVVYDRHYLTGKLAWMDAIRNSDPGVEGLTNAEDVAVSPDGAHVYVVGRTDDSVVAFSRNASTGELSFVEAEYDGVDGVDGLWNASSVAISPDGNNVYVTGWTDAAIAVFSRDVPTGTLEFAQVLTDTGTTVEGLNGARDCGVSPDGRHVYVAGLEDNAVAVFERNLSTGELSFVEAKIDGVAGIDGIAGAHSVAISPDGFHVYVAGGEDDAVAVFSRDDITGQLTPVEIQRDGVGGVDGLNSATSVALSPDGNHVYATGYDDHAVAVFARNETSGGLTFVEVHRDDVNGVDGLYTARSIAVSPNGENVYIIGSEEDAVAVFARSSSGALSFLEVHKDADGLDGARSVAIHPDGSHVFVVGREDDAIVTLERNPLTGAVTYSGWWQDGDLGTVDGLEGANAVAVSPDGLNVYVASVYDNAVASFNWYSSSQSLSFSQVITDGTFPVDTLGFASGIAVSPDGKHVYVTAAVDDAVTTFSRHPTTGQLAYASDVQDGDDHGLIVDGLDGAYSVAVSPDGWHVYVAGGEDDAVSAFVRSNIDGHLTFIQVVTDTGAVVNGLDRARSVTVSPDGEQVYVASFNASTLTVYDRDPLSGYLTFVEIHEDLHTPGSAYGLGGAHSVVVSPDGLRVYVVGAQDDALGVYYRDLTTGALTLGDEIWDNVSGVHGLEYAASIAVSPSGSHVYVASFHDDAIAAFRRAEYVFLPLALRSY